MAREQQELPAGYAWQRLGETESHLARPESWFYGTVVYDDNRSFFLTREPSGWETPGGTNLMVRIYQNTTEVNKLPAEKFAYWDAKGDSSMRPRTLLARADANPLIIFERLFDIPFTEYNVGTLYDRKQFSFYLSPRVFQLVAIANTQTDTVHSLAFSTPFTKWQHDEEIARVAFQHIRLDKSL